jgi:hypothetical protein
MEVVGKVKFIDTEKEVGTSGFKKRDIVITTEEQYPQDILVQFVQDKCSILNNFKVGDSVEVGINLRGREWLNDKGETVYFNTIQGWKISKSNNDAPSAKKENPILTKEENDLPF